jgi:hypothetical protein
MMVQFRVHFEVRKLVCSMMVLWDLVLLTESLW